jgi:hypothetical protein
VAGVLAFICATGSLAFEPVRSLLVRTTVSAALALKGFELRNAVVRLSRSQLSVGKLAVNDYSGAPFLDADSVQIRYAIHGLHLSINDVDIERPHLVLRREADGTFNASRLLNGEPKGGFNDNAPARSRGKLVLSGVKLSIQVRNGSIDFQNPQAPARPGRSLALNHIMVSARFDPARPSRGLVTASLSAPDTAAVPIRVSFLENDRTRFATLDVDASKVPLAPILDFMVSSPAFIVERGNADLAVRGYAVAWPDQNGPQWHVLARGTLHNGRLTVTPLIAPARDLTGRLQFMDGVLTLPGITGNVARAGMTAYGSIILLPAPQLDLFVRTAGPLLQIRNMLAISKGLPLTGHIDARARINGTPTDPRVSVNLDFPHGLRYAHTPLARASVALVYYRNHVALPLVSGRSAGFDIDGSGDVDLGAQKKATPSGQFIVSLRGPSAAIPWIANLDDCGTLSGRVTLSGPLTQLEGSGFLRLNGSRSSVRTTFSATHDRFTLGPLLALDRHGGSLWLAASISRRGNRGSDAHLVAHDFALELNGRRTVLPGVFDRPFGMPATSARIDGVLAETGPLTSAQFNTRLRERNLTIGGTSYGDLELTGFGQAGLGWLHINGSNARIAGIPIRNANVVAGFRANQIRIYGASANVAGGLIALGGELSTRGAHPQAPTLVALARGIELGSLHGIGIPTSAGVLTAFGRLSGTRAHPRASMSGVVSNAEFAGTRLSGDTHIDYNGRQVIVGESRVLLGSGSALNTNGTITGLGRNASPADVKLSIMGQMREGDMREIAGLNLPAALPLTGSIDATIRASGTLASPVVDGSVESPVGTARGVTFEDLRARFGLQRGSLSLSGGHIVIGTSAMDVGGEITPASAAVRLSSPHLDLSDFNDFYGGKDVAEGVGSLHMSLATYGSSSSATGDLAFNDAEIAHVPLGSLRGSFSKQARSIVATINQRGPLARSTVNATVSFQDKNRRAPDFANVMLDVNGSARDIDLGMLVPLLPAAAQGLRGRLDVAAAARGRVGQLVENAHFKLANGFIGKERIDELSGGVSGDNSSVRVDALRLSVGGIALAARAAYSRGGHIAGHAVVQTNDVRKVARIIHAQSPLSGSAAIALDAAGTTARPHVHAFVHAGRGSAFGVSYQGFDADARYAPDVLEVRKASLELAPGDGSVVADGRVPLTIGPQPLGQRESSTRNSLAVNIRASGFDLSVLNPVLGQRGSLGGKFDFRAAARGSLGRPKLTGVGSLRDATVRSKLETVPLTGLNADLALANDTITLTKFHGTLGKGSIDASGVARFVPVDSGSGGDRLAYSARVSAKNANLTVPQLFNGILNMNLGLQGTRSQPQLSGTIDVSDTDVPFAGILALASGTSSGTPQQAAVIPGVPPLQKGHTVAYGGSIYGDQVHLVVPTPKAVKQRLRPSAPIALDIMATADKNVQTTGLVSATGTGSIHIGGTAASPSLQGMLRVVRGQVGLFDTTFDLQRGFVAFHPRDGFLPTVDAVAVAYRPEAEVMATVEGRVDQLKTQITSDPAMPEHVILANILHINEINQALSGGGAQQAPNAGAAIGNFVGSAVTGKLLSALNYGLEQTLHVEQINLAFDSNGLPSLELRKQYGPHTYAMFRQSFAVPPQQAYGIVYTLRNALEMDFEQRMNPPGSSTGQGPFASTRSTLFQVTARFDAHRRTHKPNHNAQKVHL